MTDVSQAVNEHLVDENERLTLENAELRASLAHARDQWKTMASIVERLERMDRRLEIAIRDRDAYDDSRDYVKFVGEPKSSRMYSQNTNSTSF